METEIFSYFMMIGAGLSVGLTIGLIPGYLFIKWQSKWQRGKGNVFKIEKNRTRT